jgi:tetratricopeptide (TPR) repeat protein
MRAAYQCIGIVISLCLVGVVGVARADRYFPRPKNAEACAHLERGNQLYGLRKFQEAIAEYEAGALIEPSPVFDYNLGQANRQLENYRAALWYYERFMNETPHPAPVLREAVIADIAEMNAHLADKTTRIPPAGPEPSPNSVQAPAVQGAPVGAVDASGNQDRLRVGPQPRHPDWIGWSVVATGVAGLGLGAYLLYNASQLDDRAVSRTQSQEQRGQFGRDANGRRVAGAITIGGGAALVIAGVVKLALHDDAPNRAAWNITATNRGVMVLGRF